MGLDHLIASFDITDTLYSIGACSSENLNLFEKDLKSSSKRGSGLSRISWARFEYHMFNLCYSASTTFITIAVSVCITPLTKFILCWLRPGWWMGLHWSPRQHGSYSLTKTLRPPSYFFSILPLGFGNEGREGTKKTQGTHIGPGTTSLLHYHSILGDTVDLTCSGCYWWLVSRYMIKGLSLLMLINGSQQIQTTRSTRCLKLCTLSRPSFMV